MDRASSLIFPGGRTLAGWWRQLAAQQPIGLWVGYAFLHRIEAPVQVLADQPVEPLNHLVLQAIALSDGSNSHHGPGASLSSLQERLGLPTAVVQRVLLDMHQIGLLSRPAADRWLPSERGQNALERRSYPLQLRERRVFTFLERLDPLAQRIEMPRYAPVGECIAVPWPVDDDHRFDVANLRSSIDQSADWKSSAGFPLDVQTLADKDTSLEPWQQIVVDRPERVVLLLLAVPSETGKQVRAYAVKVDGWTLFDHAPVLSLDARAASALWPEVNVEPPIAIWQDAWRGWCRQRQLPTNEVEICSLSFRAPRLEVEAPGRLVQRLQAAKSDIFKGDAWLLAGEGYLRTVVQLTLKP